MHNWGLTVPAVPSLDAGTDYVGSEKAYLLSVELAYLNITLLHCTMIEYFFVEGA